MIFDVSYWTRVFKRILYVVFILLGLYIGLKLSVFYMPFLVAFIISLMVEPALKFIMRKTNLTRRTSYNYICNRVSYNIRNINMANYNFIL